MALISSAFRILAFSHYLLILNSIIIDENREQLCNGKSQLKPPKIRFSRRFHETFYIYTS